MIFSVDDGSKELDRHQGRSFSDRGLLERQDLQEWVIEEPRILGEELLIVSSEYQNFEQTCDRLDVLALDTTSQLVVIELKRDRADDTTDLQAITYASYCATLTAEDIQRDYRQFWNAREEQDRSPEEVGEQFASFLDDSLETAIEITSVGWADFDLNDKPRIILLAGSFGIEITAPVTWLIEEYGMEIAYIRIEVYKDNGRVLLNSQQVIPVPEAEEYVACRRESQECHQQSDRRLRGDRYLAGHLTKIRFSEPLSLILPKRIHEVDDIDTHASQ